MPALASPLPTSGQLVYVRTRNWLVEEAAPSPYGSWLRLACVDDDAQGDALEVIWEAELDGHVLDAEAWEAIGSKGFDDPRLFAAYFNTLRWHCVTATDPKLFQAPFRAGIRVEAYQLEPLRKALQLPRVNLFIADDVGLGKTIEAGLIATELLLRRRVREVVVVCPPSMLNQWQDELDARFGLRFEILDRNYVDRIRRDRGYAVNPWDTFPRFLVSHRLLIDETYASPMRVWLDNLRPGTLLILDEAHHAAPASGSKYAIDSKFTRAIRDLAPRFEHRLFLSATPHNGHSNSFSALLELLDDRRFMRGVPVLKSSLDAVMVRRLKEDVRAVAGGFPERRVVQVDLQGLPPEAPELRLAEWLDAYGSVRRQRFAGASRREQVQGGLILSTLQQRLFSSVEAFHRTLAAHRRAMERVWAGDTAPRHGPAAIDAPQLTAGFDNDDDRALLPAEEQEAEAAEAVSTVTAATVGSADAGLMTRERQLLDQMAQLAEQHRHRPDARVNWLLQWLQDHACAGVRRPGQPPPSPGAAWAPLRILIFTEYEDTARYLRAQLESAIAGTAEAGSRLAVFHGPTPPQRREELKRAFNEPPERHPLRILIATDAAREGLNLQAHCWNLFHFDLPWNPSRLEQRNGRIDRKLQPSPEVFCHYFVYQQRPEDRVLRALVRKTETIRLELGSLSEVIEKRLRSGLRRSEIEEATREIEAFAEDPGRRAAREAELDDQAQQRQTRLRAEIQTLTHRIQDARRWIGLDESAFRDALDCSLQCLDVAPLQPLPGPSGEPTRFAFPNLQTRKGGDPRWAATLDTLRPPKAPDQTLLEWRQAAPLRPVIFAPPSGIDDDTVQLHLSHRVAQRLLGRFLAQGFYHDLSRACLAQSDDSIPRVVLLGRLALYGAGAARLHEQLLTVTARWMEPTTRKAPLSPYGRDAETRTMNLLQESLRPGRQGPAVPEAARQKLQASMAQDIRELLPHLEERGLAARSEAEKVLSLRGQAESESITQLLLDQQRRVLTRYQAAETDQLLLGFSEEEKRQLAADRRHWERWLANVEGDLTREPARIAAFYQTRSYRLEPVGLAYLWPVAQGAAPASPV